MRTLSREQARKYDNMAIREFGIPGIVLMENAGRAVASEVVGILKRERVSENRLGTVAVLCGGGNNGGDGYVAARHLNCAGVQVQVYVAADPSRPTSDAAVNFAILEKMNIERRHILSERSLRTAAELWKKADIVIDALLGPLILELNARPGLNIQLANRAGLCPRLDAIDLSRVEIEKKGWERRLEISREMLRSVRHRLSEYVTFDWN